jgi:D-xylulose reductase
LERIKLDKLVLVAKAMAGSILVEEGVPTTSKTQNSVNGLLLSMKLLHLYETGFFSTPNSSIYNSKSNKIKQNNGTNKDGKRTYPTPGVDFEA